jgi:hypothetical protein
MWENGGCLPRAKITALLFLRRFTQFPCPNLSENFLADYFRSIRPDQCALWGCDERTVVERLYWRSQGVAVIVKKLNWAFAVIRPSVAVQGECEVQSREAGRINTKKQSRHVRTR